MRLLGARQFLETAKPGTLFIQYWENSKNECLKIIQDFENGKNLLNEYYNDFHMFGDNSGSLAFIVNDDIVTIDNEDYDCLFHYDCNIVGDANPNDTLYLVFDSEDEWPEAIHIEHTEDKSLNKADLIKIQKWFLSTNTFADETLDNAWALNVLKNNDYYKDDEIVNYGGKN